MLDLNHFESNAKNTSPGEEKNRTSLEGISKFIFKKGCIVMITYALETHLVEDMIVLSSILLVVWKSLESKK